MWKELPPPPFLLLLLHPLHPEEPPTPPPIPLCTPSPPGLVILERNWLDVYNRWENWHAATLPYLQVGQAFHPTALTMEQGRTEAPPLLSEADLIAVGKT